MNVFLLNTPVDAGRSAVAERDADDPSTIFNIFQNPRDFYVNDDVMLSVSAFCD